MSYLGRFCFSPVFLGLSLAAGFVSTLLFEQRPFEELELKSYDLRLSLLQRRVDLDTSIVIVLIDEDDIRRYGDGQDGSEKWPLPRKVYAQLVDTLSARGAKIIGFDLLFLQPDRHALENDTSFARAMRRAGNVMLPFTFDCLENRGDVRDISRFAVRSAFMPESFEGERRLKRICVPSLLSSMFKCTT
jgi:CHASE2 domain-containing sensor protein